MEQDNRKKWDNSDKLDRFSRRTRVGRRILEYVNVALLTVAVTGTVMDLSYDPSPHSSFHTFIVRDSPNSHSSLQLVEGENTPDTGRNLYVRDKTSGLMQEIATNIEVASWSPNGRDIAFIQKNGTDQTMVSVYDTQLKVLAGEKVYRTNDVAIKWDQYGNNDPNPFYAVHVTTPDIDMSSQVDSQPLHDWVFPLSYDLSLGTSPSPKNPEYVAIFGDDMNYQISTLLIFNHEHLIGRIEGGTLPYWSSDGTMVGFETVGTGGIGIFDMKTGKVVAFTKYQATTNDIFLEWSRTDPNTFEMVDTSVSTATQDGKVVASVTAPIS